MKNNKINFENGLKIHFYKKSEFENVGVSKLYNLRDF